MKRIYLDFDGTVVEHEYPKLGRFVPNALEVVQKLIDKGHTIILNTYRADCNDGTLELAIGYLKNNQFVYRGTVPEIVPHIVLENKVTPEKWGDFTKEAIFIDDVAPNIPLRKTWNNKGEMVD